MIKTIYTIKNLERRVAYVGQTNNLARRIAEHSRGKILKLLGLGDRPLRAYVMSNVAILETFKSENPNLSEREEIESVRDEGFVLLNKKLI